MWPFLTASLPVCWQVVAYNPGEFYAEHYDNRAGAQITRPVTAIIYLNDCEGGGSTFFPKSAGKSMQSG